jgi:curved DNA binding protein
MADNHLEDELNEDEQQDELSNPDVVTKYKTAADIANKALSEVIKQVAPGKLIVELCSLGDKIINDALAQVYKGKATEKGVAFPTSISVNNCCGHFSPLGDDTSKIEEGDVVKIDLGVHIDGFISVAAHTLVASATATPITGRKADVICAAHIASEVAHRLIKPGTKNTEVTEVIAKVAQEFECQPLEGVLSHQMKRFVIDGNNVIINKETVDQKVDEFEFEENQVYGVDIVISSGEGKAKELETRTTIFKRAVDQNYLLKMKASRYVFNEMNAKFPTLPFTLRAFDDEKKARLGITECLKHDLVSPYPVLFEKPGDFVAQFKFTVLILPSGTIRLNSQPLPYVTSDKEVKDEKIKSILATGTKRAKKSKKKKKAPKEGSEQKEGAKDAQKMDTNEN